MLSLGLLSLSVEPMRVILISLCLHFFVCLLVFVSFFTYKMQVGKCMFKGLNGLMHENIKMCELPVTKQSRGCQIQHRDYSQYYCNNSVWGQMGTLLPGVITS